MSIEQSPLGTYQRLFVHRRDIHARQRADGSYVLRRAPITPRLLAAHLAGQLTIGLYALTPDGTTRWAARRPSSTTCSSVWCA